MALGVLLSNAGMPADLKRALNQLDHSNLTRFHLELVVLSGIPWMWVSIAIGIIGFILPSLEAAFPWTSSQLGLLVSAGLLGFLLGAILTGRWTDRFGRKTMMLLATAGVGLSLMASGLAWNFTSLVLLRVGTGFCSGAVMPVTNALVSEYSPARFRGRVVILLSGFWGLGGIVAALIGYLLAPALGWRPPLLVGGLILLILPLLQRRLPRSLRFLMEAGRFEDARLQFSQLENRLAVPAGLVESQASEGGVERAADSIWTSRYVRPAALLSIIWFTLNFAFYGVFVWLPSVLVYGGLPLSESLRFTLLINLAQLPGSLSAAFLADWVGRRLSMGAFLAFYAAALAAFALRQSPSGILLWGSAFAFFNAAAWGVGYIMTVERFPTSLRATGLGWTNGIGRSGGIVAPAIMGVLLESPGASQWIFFLTAVVLVFAIVPCTLVGGEAKGRSLEEITGSLG